MSQPTPVYLKCVVYWRAIDAMWPSLAENLLTEISLLNFKTYFY